MATAVQLEITVDNSGAVLGIKQLGDAFNKIPPPPRQVRQEFDGIESAERRAHIAGQLFVRTTGVEMPRALENVIAKSKVLGPLLGAAFNASVFVAAGAALFTVAEKIINVNKQAELQRQAWIDVNATVQDTGDKIIDEMNKQKQKYIELTQGPIAAMTFALQHMRSVAVSAFSDISGEAEKAIKAFNDQGGFLTVSGRESKEAADAVKKTIADMNDAVHQAAAQNSKDLTAPFVAEQKVLQKAIDDTQAKLDAASRPTFTSNRFTGSEMVAPDQKQLDVLRQALALYENVGEQIKNQIQTQKDTSAAADAEALNVKRQAYAQVVALQHAVTADQLGGIAKIRAEETAAIDEVLLKEKDKRIALQTVALIHQQSAEKERQAELDISKSTRDAQLFAEQRANSFLQGSEKIVADADHEKDVLLADLTEYLTRSKHAAEEVQAAWGAYYTKSDAIDKASKEQLAINQQQLLDKLIDAQQRAAIAALPEWQRADAQILLDRQKTFEEINRLEARDAQNTAVYEAQKVAADQLANAQIIENHKRMTIELGSDLESIYDDIGSGNIGKRILNNIKKLFFQIVAEWLLATKTMGGIFGKLFGTLLGGPQSTLENASGGGLGSLLGLFGAPAAANVSGGLSGGSAAGGTAGGPSALASALGLGGFFGGSAVPGTAAAGFGAAGALTTSSIASTGGGIGAVAGGALGAAATGGASKSIFGNLFTPTGVAGAGALLLGLFGGKLGGTVGQIGGTLTALSVLSQSNPAIGALLSHLGLGGELAGTLLAAAGPALLGFGVGTKFGPLGGALAGGGVGFGAGALIGLAGGPIGALIGGIIGAIAGLFGGLFGSSKRKKAANAYFDQQVGPAIKKIEDDYKGFSIDFSTAMQELEDLRTQSQKQLKSLKGQGSDVFKKKVSPAIDQAEKEINTFETERQRRSGLVFGPPQFHDGGFVDAARSPFMRQGEIAAILKHGEFVVNPIATAKHRGQLERINAGVGGSSVTIGSVVLTPTVLDRDYVRGKFIDDLRDAMDRMRREGR